MQVEGVEGTIRRAQAYAATGVDALFFTGVDTREQLEAISAAVDIPIFLGRIPPALADRDYLSAQRVRIALQGHLPIMAAIQTVHDVMKALRDGTPPGEVPGVASDDLVKQVTRDADYRGWMRDFLGG
jgi:carboxyvinyl-carboxyphosphonate phosphorylmutase